MGTPSLEFVPITRARFRSPLRPSLPSPITLLFLRLVSPFYLRFALKFQSIEIQECEKVVDLWKAFQNDEIRLIIAFRHPYGDEPQLFSYAFDVLLPRKARMMRRPLRNPVHARFVHGYEVALWGGSLVRWLLPRIGALPVYHAKMEAGGIKNIRNAIRNGPFPLALASEGQISYLSETVSRLENGGVQMGFWCAEELEKEKRSERVVILPLSVHHRFDPRDFKKLHAFLSHLEKKCGLDPITSGTASVKERLFRLEACILAMTEEYYAKSYGVTLAAERDGHAAVDADVTADENQDLCSRWKALMDASLAHAEFVLGIQLSADKDAINRVYAIRQVCWDRMYPRNETGKPCALDRAFTNRRTGEAWYAMRHMEFVDIAFYLDGAYLNGVEGGDPSFDRLVETAHNLDDLVSRLAGGDIRDRPNFMRKKAVIIPGEIIDITSRLSDYQLDRKKAVANATASLKNIFIDCINTFSKG